MKLTHQKAWKMLIQLQEYYKANPDRALIMFDEPTCLLDAAITMRNFAARLRDRKLVEGK